MKSLWCVSFPLLVRKETSVGYLNALLCFTKLLRRPKGGSHSCLEKRRDEPFYFPEESLVSSSESRVSSLVVLARSLSVRDDFSGLVNGRGACFGLAKRVGKGFSELSPLERRGLCSQRRGLCSQRRALQGRLGQRKKARIKGLICRSLRTCNEGGKRLCWQSLLWNAAWVEFCK